MQDNATPNLLTDKSSNISAIIQRMIKSGFSHEHFWINEESYSRFTRPGYKTWLTRNSRLSYPMINATVSYICKNKHITYEYAKKFGVQVPCTKYVTPEARINTKEQEELLWRHKRLVVKPSDSAQSRGLTLDIATMDGLKGALLYAHEYSREVLIQEQVYGEEARFIIFEGKTKAVLLRQTPRLVGDGKSTVRQLFDIENTNRKNIVKSVVPYPVLSSYMIENYDPSYIPHNKEVLELSRSTLISGGASVYNIINKIDSSYIQIAETLTQYLGVDFIAIDLMMKDYRAKASKNNYVLVEFNELPSLKFCSSCRDGNNYNILEDLIPLVERSLKY